MKIQYKNITYKQTNWSCCDCALVELKSEFGYYYLGCPSFVKMNCCEHAFKREMFNSEIFNL